MKRLIISCMLAAFAALTFASGSHREAPKHHRSVVDYAHDVAPILNSHCVSCHRPGEVAPFSLIGYDSARRWSSMTATVTASRKMPPWKAVDGYGEFKDVNLLSKAEIQTITDWSEHGCPRGDRRAEPKLKLASTSEWINGNPDMVLQAAKPYHLGPEGADVYRNFVFELHNEKPLWVTAIEAKPENKRIVHHVIAFLDEHGQAAKLQAGETDGEIGYTSSGGGAGFMPDGSLGGWAPGVRPMNAPAGLAFLVKPHTSVVLQVHYHRSGKAEEDRTKLGLYFSKVPVEHQLDLVWFFNFNLNIPPGEKDYKVSRTITFPRPVTLYTVMPHMHLLGRKMKSWLIYPDGSTKPLIMVDDWDFNWQLVYRLKEPIRVPAGTKQVLEADYDNSSENPRNPSTPPKQVRWGEQTTDEMCLLIESYTTDAPVAAKWSSSVASK